MIQRDALCVDKSSRTAFLGCEKEKSEYNLAQENLAAHNYLHAKILTRSLGAPIDVQRVSPHRAAFPADSRADQCA